MLEKVYFLFHNTVQHPLAGVIWFIAQVTGSERLNKLGDLVHDSIENWLDSQDSQH